MAERYEAPIPHDLALELFHFWDRIFGGVDPDVPMEVFLGEEVNDTQVICYLERDGDTLAGTCGISISKAVPRLAGLGEVATEPRYRGRGIAARLSQLALTEFADQGGEVIFLGTGNPAASRIYHRLGWRKLAGANVWANVITGDSPEEYLVDYFRAPSSVSIAPGDAALRVAMVPLLLAPHDWQVLDGNLTEPMISTRYAVQDSCMGLCRKYLYLVARDDADWFAAKTGDGRIVGICTARVDDGNVCWIDGFTHARFDESFGALIETAIEWGALRNADRFAARLSVEDVDKQNAFESLGFRRGEAAGVYALGNRDVAAVTMTRQ